MNVTLLKFRSVGRAFTLRQSQFRTKKEYCFAEADASPPLRTLAGIKRPLCQDWIGFRPKNQSSYEEVRF
jgi:hypothetical protein